MTTPTRPAEWITVSFRCPAGLVELLDAAAAAEDRSRSNVIIRILRAAFEQAGPEEITSAARELGRLGGSAKTEAKAEAARANGAKGGRPRKAR